MEEAEFGGISLLLKLLRRQKQEAYKFKGCLCYPVECKGQPRQFKEVYSK